MGETVLQLPLERGHVPEAQVQPDVVVAADPVLDGGHGLGPRAEPVAADELALQARPKRLGCAVVEARGHPTCGLGDPETTTEVPVVLRQILRASVRMEDDTADIAISACACTVECPTDEVGWHGGVHLPADDTTRTEVQDRGQVQPALCRAHVGDVASPALIGSTDGEVLADEVGQRWGTFCGQGRPGGPAPGRDAHDGVVGHV